MSNRFISCHILIYVIEWPSLRSRVISFLHRSSLVERMPVLNEAAYITKRAASSQETLSANKTIKPTSYGAPLSVPNGVAKPPAAPLVDLLDLSADVAPVPSSSTTDFLHDLLGVDLTSPSSGFSSENLLFLALFDIQVVLML